MRIIHGQGYSKSDRLKFKILVFRNIMASTHAMLEAMDSLKITYTNPDSKRHVQLLCGLSPDTGDILQVLTYFWTEFNELGLILLASSPGSPLEC